jgi:hypothetical protein
VHTYIEYYAWQQLALGSVGVVDKEVGVVDINHGSRGGFSAALSTHCVNRGANRRHCRSLPLTACGLQFAITSNRIPTGRMRFSLPVWCKYELLRLDARLNNWAAHLLALERYIESSQSLTLPLWVFAKQRLHRVGGLHAALGRVHACVCRRETPGPRRLLAQTCVCFVLFTVVLKAAYL